MLVARESLIRALVARGFDAPSAWEARLGAPSRVGSGRGTTATVQVGGQELRLKRMRRGGLAGPLWRDRFPGMRRLHGNLVVPVEAARRGVATPLPVALLVVAGPFGLNRAWLASEEVRGTMDLREACSDPRGPDPERLAAAIAAVRRMHDAGVEHRDLNLANLLVSTTGPPRAWIVDLDGARLRDGPLSLTPRRAALDRLERSWAKSAPASHAAGARTRLVTLYAGADRELAAALARGRRVSRYRIALHRLGWRR
jgi:3-deoxy-D-manno-octulosonic acid kinase